MPKIKIGSGIYDRAKKAAKTAGYSSLEEFVTHVIEKELTKYESSKADEKVAEKLRGLGYID